MREFTRIFHNRRLLAVLLLIFLTNGFLFTWEQGKESYGLDLSPPPSVFISVGADGQMPNHGTEITGAACYQAYRTWLSKVRDMPLTEAGICLAQEKERLSGILELADLLETRGGLYGQDKLNEYREKFPELTQQLERGTADLAQLERDDADLAQLEHGDADLAQPERGDADLAQLERGDLDLAQAQLDYAAVNNLLRQITYLEGYDAYLSSIQANKENMLTFSIFNDPNSFSGRNILKTAAEFDVLQGITLKLGADGAVNAFMSFPLTDYLLLAVLALICLAFLEERKKGLWSIVHATPHGRLRLAWQRGATVLGTSVCGVLLLYGSNILLGFFIYGGWEDLGRAVQSVEILGTLPVLCSVGSFLLRYFFLRIGAAFLMGLLMWLLLLAITNVKYTIVILAVFLTVEYVLYTFLPVQSVFNLFKYFNIFTYISLSELYVNYLNINLFGYPLGIRSQSQLALLPLCAAMAAGCLFLHCHKKPFGGKDLLGRAAYGINRVCDCLLKRLRMLGMELHKTLFIQKGIVIGVVFVYAAAGLSYTQNIPVYSAVDLFAKQYIIALEGVADDALLEKMDRLQADLDGTIDAFEEAKKQYARGDLSYPQFDVYAREEMTAQLKIDALAMVRLRAENLRELGKQKGFIPWLLDETPYESVYGEAAQGNQQTAALVSILALSLLLAGCMAYERQSGIACLLVSTPRGRRDVLLRKIGAAALLTTVVWVLPNALELWGLFHTYAPHTLSVPLQNLSMLERFPLRCNIGGFMALLYGLRWLMLFGCALIVLGISQRSRRLETAYAAVVSVTVLPSLLYFYIGIAPMKYLSLARCVTVMELLVPGGGSLGAGLPAILTMVSACGAALWSLKRGWRI